MAILNCLAEIRLAPDLRISLKFELEMLFRYLHVKAEVRKKLLLQE